MDEAQDIDAGTQDEASAEVGRSNTTKSDPNSIKSCYSMTMAQVTHALTLDSLSGRPERGRNLTMEFEERARMQDAARRSNTMESEASVLSNTSTMDFAMSGPNTMECGLRRSNTVVSDPASVDYIMSRSKPVVTPADVPNLSHPPPFQQALSQFPRQFSGSMDAQQLEDLYGEGNYITGEDPANLIESQEEEEDKWPLPDFPINVDFRDIELSKSISSVSSHWSSSDDESEIRNDTPTNDDDDDTTADIANYTHPFLGTLLRPAPVTPATAESLLAEIRFAFLGQRPLGYPSPARLRLERSLRRPRNAILLEQRPLGICNPDPLRRESSYRRGDDVTLEQRPLEICDPDPEPDESYPQRSGSGRSTFSFVPSIERTEDPMTRERYPRRSGDVTPSSVPSLERAESRRVSSPTGGYRKRQLSQI